MHEIAVRVIVTGRVQGVGFRLFVVHEAARLGVRGWVRNRRDGSVEALMIGRERDVEALVAACRRGPRLAEVTGVARESVDDDGSGQFHERPTA